MIGAVVSIGGAYFSKEQNKKKEKEANDAAKKAAKKAAKQQEQLNSITTLQPISSTSDFFIRYQTPILIGGALLLTYALINFSANKRR